MTQCLAANEIGLFRALKKTAIVLMLMLRLDKPLGEVEIAGILDIHRETIRAYLKSLSCLGVVARSHRYSGWILTAGGRQMILGQPAIQLPAETAQLLPEGKINAMAKNSSSSADGLSAMTENPSSRAKISSSMAKNPSSPPAAAASLSLSFKEEKDNAAAANTAMAENPPSMVENPSSQLLRANSQFAAAGKMGKIADPVVLANLQAFTSIGLVQNRLVLEICKMDHVTPDYILGQKRRLEAERRYSHALLLTVVRCKDELPTEYRPREYQDSHPDDSEGEAEPDEGLVPEDDAGEEDADASIPRIELDPSIHEPVSENAMTAARAWETARCQLQRDMPKSAYDGYVRDLVLLSARDGTFVIGARNDYAREWLESRMTSTIMRLLIGICNRCVEVTFVILNDSSLERAVSGSIMDI